MSDFPPGVTRWDLIKAVLDEWLGFPHRHRWQRNTYPSSGWDGSMFYLRKCTVCLKVKP